MKAIIFMLLPAMLFGLTSNQKVTMKRVREIAKKYTKYSVTITAICGAETSWRNELLGDLNGKVINASFGEMQVTLRTARWIINKNHMLKDLRGISDTNLITMLLTDLDASIRIAASILNDHIKRHGYFGGVSGYNGGLHNKRYFNRVMKFKRIVLKEMK